ncbi:hypothetical protein, partial [Bacteroides acidifaciens]|uniref:hypothetical protein n=1 Tax=Bacteroides acidifaciens TaxID=85831 RepID=UPI0025B5B7B0
GKVNTGFGVGIFIPQLFRFQFSVFSCLFSVVSFQLSVGVGVGRSTSSDRWTCLTSLTTNDN